MRRAARTDFNHTRVVRFLRQLGARVFDTSAVGKGFPDLVVCWRDNNLLVEVKNPEGPPSKRKLTPAEQEFHDSWPGPLHVVATDEDVVEMLEAYE